MKRFFYFGIIFFSVLWIYLSVSGCGASSAGNNISVPVEPGEHIDFGSYQGEDIEWRVLDVKDGNVLLLSEYGLDVKPYHETTSLDIGWEDCTLRQWLNNEFYEDAFTDGEKELIILSLSEGFPESNSRAVGGRYVYYEREEEDHVFLLSYSEVCHYFSSGIGAEWNCTRFCSPTEYVKNNFDIPIYQNSCGWWLGAAHRGYADREEPVTVSPYGGINLEPTVNSMKYAVRPAIWIQWQDSINDTEQGGQAL